MDFTALYVEFLELQICWRKISKNQIRKLKVETINKKLDEFNQT